MLLIGPNGPFESGFLNGTFKFSACTPAESHEIMEPLLCFADWPTATTGDVSPFRYAVKSVETVASSEVELCGISTPSSSMLFEPGCWTTPP